MTTQPQTICKSAVISGCGTYRYHLTRTWNPDADTLGFIMLNPSTADADLDDATIRKCCGFARRLGYGSIEVVNLFAYRTTHPKVLKEQGSQGIDVVGPKNDKYILQAAASAKNIICAWGNHGSYQGRGDKVLELLMQEEVTTPTLSLGRLSNSNQPKHPLYQPYDVPLYSLEWSEDPDLGYA